MQKENKFVLISVGALKKHELSEEHKTNLNNLKADCSFFSPHNTASLNWDSSLLNYPGEATSQSENNVSVIENAFLQSTQNENSIIVSFNNKVKPKAEIIWSLFCVRHGFSGSSMTNFIAMLSRMFPGVRECKKPCLW